MEDRVRQILVVDDNRTQRMLTCRELSSLGAKVSEAVDGVDALEQVAKALPDLVILDMEMPRMGGLEFCQRMGERTETQGVPIVMLSANQLETTQHQALEAGALEYFYKGEPIVKLRQLARKLFERIERNRQKWVFSLDADPAVTQLVRGSLRRHGFTHRGFEDADELIAALEERPCDVLLLSFQLPQHGTHQVLKALQRQEAPERMGIVAMTASRDHRELIQTYHFGARDLLLKPFTSEELTVRISQLLTNLEQETELRTLATIDPLTRLNNRGELVRRARTEIERAVRDKMDLGVLLLDLDHFKKLNDTFGHPFGDEVLRRTGETIAASVRATDVCGRYGGEEFAFLLPRATMSGVAVMAERLRRTIADMELENSEGIQRISVSIGGVTWSHQRLARDMEFAALITPCDEALYAAKGAGRNCCVCDPESAKDVRVA